MRLAHNAAHRNDPAKKDSSLAGSLLQHGKVVPEQPGSGPNAGDRLQSASQQQHDVCDLALKQADPEPESLRKLWELAGRAKTGLETWTTAEIVQQVIGILASAFVDLPGLQADGARKMCRTK
jgi:hypothetical protein